MNKIILTPEYFFAVTQQNICNDYYQLSLIGANPDNFKNGTVERVSPEVIRLNSWQEIHLCKDMFKILGIPSDKDTPAVPEQIFYARHGDLLFGEDLVTNRSMLGRIYGSANKDDLWIPVILGLQVSQVRFNNINLFNYPTPDHATQWETALRSKWMDYQLG